MTIHIILVPHFIPSTNGRKILCIGNYRYGIHYGHNAPKKTWICTKKNSGCRAKVVTIDNVIVKTNNEHIH